MTFTKPKSRDTLEAQLAEYRAKGREIEQLGNTELKPFGFTINPKNVIERKKVPPTKPSFNRGNF